MSLPLEQFSEPVATVFQQRLRAAWPILRNEECDRLRASAIEAMGPEALFPAARDSRAALSGLMLYLGCWEKSHAVVQEIASREGSY